MDIPRGASQRSTVQKHCIKVISRLFRLLDMLNDIVRANHFQGLIVLAKKALCHRMFIFGLKVAVFDEFLQPNPEP